MELFLVICQTAKSCDIKFTYFIKTKPDILDKWPDIEHQKAEGNRRNKYIRRNPILLLLLARFFTTPVFDLPSAISFHLFLTIIPEVTCLPVLSDPCRHLKVISLHYMLSEVLLLPDHTVLLLSHIPEADMLHQRDWCKLQDCTVN